MPEWYEFITPDTETLLRSEIRYYQCSEDDGEPPRNKPPLPSNPRQENMKSSENGNQKDSQKIPLDNLPNQQRTESKQPTLATSEPIEHLQDEPRLSFSTLWNAAGLAAGTVTDFVSTGLLPAPGNPQ